MTLDEMYQKFAIDCGLDLDTVLAKDSNGDYADTVTVKQFLGEANRAIRKIAREKFELTQIEPVMLDDDLMFYTDALSETFHSIKLLADSSGREFSYARASTAQYKVPEGSPGQELNLTYGFIPVEITSLNDDFPLPEGDVDPNIVGYWVNYMYFKVDGNTKKANAWLELWNDGLESEINSNRGEFQKIKGIYN